MDSIYFGRDFSGAGHDLQAQRVLPTRRQTALYVEWKQKYRQLQLKFGS